MCMSSPLSSLWTLWACGCPFNNYNLEVDEFRKKNVVSGARYTMCRTHSPHRVCYIINASFTVPHPPLMSAVSRLTLKSRFKFFNQSSVISLQYWNITYSTGYTRIEVLKSEEFRICTCPELFNSEANTPEWKCIFHSFPKLPPSI